MSSSLFGRVFVALLVLSAVASVYADDDVSFVTTLRYNISYQGGQPQMLMVSNNTLDASGCHGIAVDKSLKFENHIFNVSLGTTGTNLAMDTSLTLFPNSYTCEGASQLVRHTITTLEDVLSAGVTFLDGASNYNLSGVARVEVAISRASPSNDGGDKEDVSRLSHIALGTSLALIFVAAILACLLRKRCSQGSPLKEQPHTVPGAVNGQQQHAGYSSMA